ncbi:MAG: DUF2760 domain-containing protein [Pirellulaceae bacterium]
MRIGLAVRVFFRILLDASFARTVRAALERPAGDKPAEETFATQRTEVVEKVIHKSPQRSDAISLLATLQREARLIDMVKEPLTQYNDAQVGAAARDVLRDCGRVLDRLFELQPVVDQEEGSLIDVPAGYDTGRYRLTGKVGGSPPFQGRLVHHGWLATRCEVPTWSGSVASSMIVAPQEVEVL